MDRDFGAESERITPAYRPVQVKKTAPCQEGCANCGDIRGWIGTVAQRSKLGISREEAFARSWRMIADVNPFPGSLGRVCPHPCEECCNRSSKDEPLAINAMERFLGDWAIEQGLELERLENASPEEWIGVVGAGPSGLSFAYQMVRRGYRVTIYESRAQAGGMLRFGVPDYRLPQDVLDAEIQRILDLGVDLKLNTAVGRDISLEALRARHVSLYLGIGAQKGRGIGIPGEKWEFCVDRHRFSVTDQLRGRNRPGFKRCRDRGRQYGHRRGSGCKTQWCGSDSPLSAVARRDAGNRVRNRGCAGGRNQPCSPCCAGTG